jgi:hypothetical protein
VRGVVASVSFDTIAEVALARDLLRRWWGLELGYAAGDGSGYDRTSHATCSTLQARGDACAWSVEQVACYVRS